MSLTPSNMLPLKSQAPDFVLPEPLTSNNLYLADCRGSQGTVVVFMCNHCPFVVHVLDGIIQMANDYQHKGIGFVAISSNDVSTHPQDAPDKMAALAAAKGFLFPYLYDESQAVARAYDAACTPDFYLFDGDLKCLYRGRMDGSRPGNSEPVSGEDLRAAMDALLAGESIAKEQLPSMGCNIKWKI